jgi:hypothetical protein
MFNFFSNRQNNDYDENSEDSISEDNNNNNLQSYFQDEIIYINGDESGYTSWITKLSPYGVKYLQPWELNRDVDEKFVESIRSDQEKFYKKHKRYDFIDPLHLCKNEDDTYEVIDGQHRLSAYNKLTHQNDLPFLLVTVHRVKNDTKRENYLKN